MLRFCRTYGCAEENSSTEKHFTHFTSDLFFLHLKVNSFIL